MANSSALSYRKYRLFVGILIPKLVRDFIRDGNRRLVKEARNLKFVPLEQLHITLQFLGGEVSQQSYELIRERLQLIVPQLPAPLIKLDSLRFGFPGQTIPEVLFWDIQPNPALEQITKIIHGEIQSLNLDDVKRQKDYAKLIHHLTVARTKRSFNRTYGRSMRTELGKQAVEGPEFLPTEAVMIESKISNQGNTYSVLATFPFAKPA